MNLISSRLKILVICGTFMVIVLAGWRLTVQMRASNHLSQINAACARAELYHQNTYGTSVKPTRDDLLCQQKQN